MTESVKIGEISHSNWNEPRELWLQLNQLSGRQSSYSAQEPNNNMGEHKLDSRIYIVLKLVEIILLQVTSVYADIPEPSGADDALEWFLFNSLP